MRLKLYPPTLVGQTINDLTVLRKTTERQSGHVIYECRCVCGRKTRVRAKRLNNRQDAECPKSCGKCQRKLARILTIRRS